MKLAVISDLHLGRGDAADRFGHDDAEFLKFLEFLEAEHERVVLLGDVYETLTSPRPLGQLEELERIREAHPEIVKRFDQPNYTFLHGNHDFVAANAMDAPNELHLKVDGTRLLFTHGHGYDWWIRHARWLTEACVWLTGWLLRLGLRSLVKVTDHFDYWLRGAQKDPGKCSFQKWAVGLAKRHDADVIVTGHTHVGAAAEHGDRLFLNSGSCGYGDYSFLSMDTKAGTYAVQTSW